MTAYAIAHLRSVRPGPDIVRYLEGIDATLEPFGGRFVVHGSPVDIREGEWPGDVIVIEFPDHDSATGWYESSAYQQILPLRTGNAEGSAILVDGVTPDHRATDVLDQGRHQARIPNVTQTLTRDRRSSARDGASRKSR